MKLSVVMLLLMSLSCSSGDEAPKPAAREGAGEANASVTSCGERADRLGQQLTELAKFAPPRSSSPPALPSVDLGIPATVRAPLVVIDGERTRYYGEDIDSHELASQLEREQEFAPASSVYAYIHASPSTTLAQVVQLLEPITSDKPWGLLVETKRQGYVDPTAGAPARVKRVIDALGNQTEPAEAATQLADELSKATGMCGPVIKLFGEIATVESSQKATTLAAGIAKSLRDCDCQVADLEMFEYLTATVLDAGDMLQRYLPVSFMGATPVIELPASATVAEWVTAIEALPPHSSAATTGLKLTRGRR